MDIAHLKRLSGQPTSLNEMWKEVKVADQQKSAKKSAKKAKENNVDSKNKAAKDVRTTDAKADIANDVSAELIDVDDTSITPKDGKKDAAGQKTIKAGERLFHTVSVGDNGVPKVDDSTTIDTVDVETWGDYGEGYVVSSTNGKVYVSEMTNQAIIGSAKLSDAVIYETECAADIVAKLFKHAIVRKVQKLHPLMEAADDCDDDFESLNEAVETTREDPLVVIWGVPKSTKYPEQGLTGHMNLSTAAKIYRFDTTGVAEAINNAAPGQRIEVKGEEKSIWLEPSQHNSKYFEACDFSVRCNLTEGMRDDINDRLHTGKKVQLSVNYNGRNITGHVVSVGKSTIRIRPTEKAKARFKIQDDEVIIPIDDRAIRWSDDHPDRIVGFAKDTQGALASTDMRGTRAQFSTANPGQQKTPAKQQASRPGRGTKANFGQGTNKQGKLDDPDSWGLTAGFNGPDGISLSEYAFSIRNNTPLREGIEDDHGDDRSQMGHTLADNALGAK